MLTFPPKIIAHRGASAYAPENTLIAFHKAKQLGANWIEFDVMLTADNIPVVFHDATLNRTTNSRGKVAEIAYEEIAKLDAGSWFAPEFAGEKVPTFKEVLLLAAELNFGINVEIKPTPGYEVVTAEAVFELLEEHWLQSSLPLLVSSWDWPSIATVREYDVNIPLGLIADTWLPNWQDVLIQLNCTSLNIEHKILTQSSVSAVKKLGKRLFAFTVNNKARAQELYEWGVDGVFTDSPDLLCYE